MNPWLNLLLSSLVGGLGVGVMSAQQGASGKASAINGLTGFLAALVQHIRQSPDLKLPPPTY